MSFRKNVLLNHSSESNLIQSENRLIYLAKTSAAEIADEGARFPDEYILGQDILKGRIRSLNEEISITEKRGKVGSLMAKLKGSTVSPVELKTKREICESYLKKLESSISNQEELDIAVKDLSSYDKDLSFIKSADFNQVNLDDLLDSDISSFFSPKLHRKLTAARDAMTLHEKTTNLLRSTGIDNPEIAEQAKFEWKEREKELKVQYKECRSGKTIDLDKARRIKADLKNKTNWINRRIAELRAQQTVTQENLENVQWLDSEEAKKFDKEYLDLVKKQATKKNLKTNRTSKLTNQYEQNGIRKVSNILGFEEKLELTNILLEARYIREAQVRKYLESKVKTVNKSFKEAKKEEPKRFNDIQERQISEALKYFENDLLANPILFKEGASIYIPSYKGGKAELKCGPSVAMQLAKNLEDTENATKGISKNTEELSGNKEQVIKDIQKKYKNFKFSINECTPERLEKKITELEKEERKRIKNVKPHEKTKYDNKFGESAIYQEKLSSILFFGLVQGFEGYEEKAKATLKNNDKLQTLLDMTSSLNMEEMDKKMQEIDALNMPGLSALQQDTDFLQSVLLGFTGEKIDESEDPLKIKDARKAQNVIDKIKGLTSPDEIIEVLEKYLGNEHFELVSNKKFEQYPSSDDPNKTRNLKNYTSGAMVFYERGDEWKVIINKDEIKNANSLVNQLTHELKHLRFESDPELKELFLNQYLRGGYTAEEFETLDDEEKNKIRNKWNAIQSAYINTFPDKTPPSGTEWKPEDILSEIFAMDEEIKNSDKYSALSSALLASGGTDRMAGLPEETFRGYEGSETADEVIEKMPEAGSSKSVESGISDEYDSYQKRIKKNQEEVNRIMNSEYTSHIPGVNAGLAQIKDYLDETEKINEAFKDSRSEFLASIMNGRIENVEKDLKGINSEMSEVGDRLPNNAISPIRDLWNRSTFLSLDDFIQVGKDVKEWWERRHKRRIADHAAKIGTALFQGMPLPIIGEFGSEAEARSQKAEAEEVNEWQSRFENKDAWELQDILKSMSNELDPNKDQLKAILRILAKKGRIDWRDESLWKLLTKLQGAVALSPNDKTLLKNPTLLRQRLHQALGEIFDYDEYLSLERDNESSYDSNVQSYMKSLDKIQDQLTERMDQLLAKHRSGENVDPQEYEAIIEYCITKGKSFAESIMFHLIVGTAEGILPADRGMLLDKHLNAWPATQWIYSKQPPLTKADYEWYAKTYFNDSYERGSIDPNKGDNSDFINFYWTEVQNDTMVIQRVRKSVSERAWDHDWGRSIAILGDANTAKRFLAGRSGQQEAKDTGVENAYVGALQWLEENAKKPRSSAREDFSRQIAWIAMAEGIIDNVAYLRGANDISSRGNESIMNATPREAPIGNHGDWTTGMHREKIKSFLDFFDRPLFNMMRNQTQAKQKGGSEKLGEDIRDYLMSNPRYSSDEGLMRDIGSITHVDHVFDKLDHIISVMVKTAPESVFENALAFLREGTEQ